MKLSILLLSTLLSQILSKAGLKKLSLKSKTSNKLKLKNKLKKVDTWSPTKIKMGNPKGKTGDEWCKDEADGGALEDCVSFWDDKTLECEEKSKAENFNHKVKCKKSADGDQQEYHDSLPNIYYMDSCWKYKMGDEADIECDRAECPNSKIHRITFAQLGLSMGKCPHFYTDFQCHQDVMYSLTEKCGGQEDCKFKVGEDLADKAKDLINMTNQEQLAMCERIKGQGDFKLTVVITCECKKQPGVTGVLKKGAM